MFFRMNNLSPLQTYQHQIQTGLLTSNPEQLEVMRELEHIYALLIKRQNYTENLLGKLIHKIKPQQPVRGLYLWGGVGIGKTYLMDLFFAQVPVTKLRIHFHEFMHMVHQELQQLRGNKNPLAIIGKDLASKYLVICFDEFFVANIVDAVILGDLFKEIFKGGTCIIASSNTAPDNLYQDGILRDKFLPAIELIQEHMQVKHLHNIQDYRMSHGESLDAYFTPLNRAAKYNMGQSFYFFAGDNKVCTDDIEVHRRKIKIIKQACDVIWFDFMSLCGVPRSQLDFLELVKRYKIVLVSDVPVFDGLSTANLITSFINLIDVLYDSGIKVVISAAKDVEKLYSAGKMLKEYQRTRSRLVEMRSKKYFCSEFR